MRVLVFVLLALFAVACGGQSPPPATPTGPAASSEAPGLPKKLDKPRMTVEYVVIHKKWVEKTMTPSPNEVSAWFEAEGKTTVAPRREQLAFKSKKSADAALARVKKSEKAEPEIADAQADGALDAAFDKLGMGDAVVVESGKMFFVLRKARPSDEAIEKAFKKAKSGDAAQKLAAALLQSLQRSDTDARAAIASVVGEILGERAVADPDRPAPTVIDDDRMRHARLQPKAKDTIAAMLKSAKAGETVKEPIVEGDTTTVARALPPTDH